MKARVFEIKRFAVHDGNGIRTTVFFKGCSLKCVWCHNPEGIDFKPQLAYYEHKCITCGECVKVCENGAHMISQTGHVFNRSLCVGCAKCADVCFGSALTFYGKEMSVEEIVSVVMEDKEFYENSDGGVTLSGGECLMQADFCRELLKKLKENGINTAVDTCGYVSKEAIDKVMPYTDIFLYDLKAVDEKIHEKCTGHPNNIIIENLKYIYGCGKNIEIRIPYVPGYNEEEIPKIAEFLSQFQNLQNIRVLPYHKYAGAKYASLDMKNTLPENVPVDEEIEMAEDIIFNMTTVKRRIK